MRSIRFYAKGNRSDNILHIETDGGIVNIRVGLHDSAGNPVTSVEILPSDESRGGDGTGNIWKLDGYRLVMKSGDEEEPDQPCEYDAWVTLDDGRYFVSIDGEGFGREGFLTREIAIYELAAAMVNTGQYPPAWLTGEHGPAVASIDDEVRAFLGEDGDSLKPIVVLFGEGDLVSWDGDPCTVYRDYGAALGVVLADGEGKPWKLVQHDEITPAA